MQTQEVQHKKDTEVFYDYKSITDPELSFLFVVNNKNLKFL